MKVIVMIGLPGSGKTTWANSFRDTEVQPVEIVSSDYYFTNKQTGEYKWTVETAHLGHENCLRDFISLLQNWVDGLSQTGVVIVDNTNVRLCDISSYIRIAQAPSMRMSRSNSCKPKLKKPTPATFTAYRTSLCPRWRPTWKGC